MSTNDIILAKNFDASNITYGDVRKNQGNQGKTIYVNYSGKPIILQTPEMRCPFGIKHWLGENGAPDKYDIQLSFDGKNVDGPVKTLYDALNSLDSKLVDDAMVNAKKWFGKAYPSREVLEALYVKTVRFSKEKNSDEISTKYEPTFKAGLPLKDGQFNVTVWDHHNRAELNLADIIEQGSSRGARVKLLVMLSGVWIVSSKFGLTWKVKQMIINRAPAPIGRDIAFVADDEYSGASAAANDDEDAPAIVRPLRGPPAASPAVLPLPAAAPAVLPLPAAAPAAPAVGGGGVLPESDEDDNDGL